MGHRVGSVIRRGEVIRAIFTADVAGIFKITCGVHMPTMQADLIVLSN